jgi:microcystin-dependent protein
MVMPFAGTSIPTGWLLCDGEEKLQATYSALYASIGNTYGAAATNYFKLPNLTGKTILGSGTGELGQTGTFTAGTGASTIPWIKMYYIIYTGKDY